MKLGGIGYVFGAFVIVPVVIFVVNMVLFRGNQATAEQITDYITNSKTMEIYIPDMGLKGDDEYFHRGEKSKIESELYYTKLPAHKGASNDSTALQRVIFFSKKHKKYMVLLTFDGFDFGGPFNLDQNDDRIGLMCDIGHYFIVRVNNNQWNDTRYGTEDKPIPVFGITVSARGYTDHDNDIDNYHGTLNLKEARSFFDVSDELNRVFVEQYLNYFLPEDEFKKMFPEKQE